MILRDYQQKSVDAVYSFLETSDGNPCVVIPTGGGKTPVLATICKDVVTRWEGRVLILTHVKELLQQAADKLNTICPEINVGVYSAGLKRRDTKGQVIVAGIQSVYKRACELGSFDLILIDEAHLIPPGGEGMYQQFLKETVIVNPMVRIVGLTATPYRLNDGLICGPDNILNEVCYEIGVKELVDQGWLCPLISKGSVHKADTSGLHKRGNEFISGEAEDLMNQDDIVEKACEEIVERTAGRNKVLIFTCGINHGQHVNHVLYTKYGIEAGFVCGETPNGERNQLIEDFKQGDLKYLTNVNVFTTGFDAPNIDCIVLLRPTLSPGLYYQMIGRGFRLDPSKADCLILDYGGNIERHGPVDEMEINESGGSGGNGEPLMKECPKCQSLCAIQCRECADCGHEFFVEPAAPSHETKASSAGIMTGQHSDREYEVSGTDYSVHRKKGHEEGDATTMRVDYRIGLYDKKSEWVCFEHEGYARKKAELWWKQRSVDPVPDTTQQAVDRAEAGVLAETKSITVRTTAGEKYDKIISYEIGELPDPSIAWAMNLNFDEIETPF